MPPYFFIPSANGHQGYLVDNDGLSDVLVPAGMTVHLPLDNGYCTNIHRPPVPLDEDLPPFESWITPDVAGVPPSPQELPADSAWVPADEVAGGLVPTFPGYTTPIPWRIDPDGHPAAAAGLLFEGLRKIITTVDELYAKEEVPPTPFSGTPAKERQTLIQQTFWLYSSLLNPADEDYRREDFAEQTWRQFMEVSGDSIYIAPEVRMEVEEGISSFWNSFEAVGVKAKVLSKTEGPTIQFEPYNCSCSYARLEEILITKDGEPVVDATTLLPGNYEFTAKFRHDCPQECQAEIAGSWVVDYLPSDGGTVLQDFGQGSRFSFEVPEEGRLTVMFRGELRCNGRPCPAPAETVPEMRLTLPVDACPCSQCRVVQPLRILNERTGEEISGNRIPTYIDRLRVEPPLVESNCPGECEPEHYAAVIETLRYRSGEEYIGWNSEPYEFSIYGPGTLSLKSHFWCHCDGDLCGQGERRRSVELVESNSCCDRIRRRNGGVLRFGFGNGTVTIRGHRLTLRVPPAAPETFHFDFNLEAVFCNLNDHQIVGVMERRLGQRLRGDHVWESMEFQDISLGHPVDSDLSRPHYILSFGKQHNGREIMVNISVDEASCVFDVQVLYRGRLYERAGPPYLTPAQLRSMASNMGYGTDPHAWYRAMMILSHLARARDYGRQEAYREALRTFLNRLQGMASRLRQVRSSDRLLRTQIDELLRAIDESRRRGFSQLDELSDKMIPVVTGV